MVKVGHFCVAAAATVDMCTAFVAPVGPAAAGLAASSSLQHARVLVSSRSQSPDTFRHHQRNSSSRRGPSRRRQQLGLQVRWRTSAASLQPGACSL